MKTAGNDPNENCTPVFQRSLLIPVVIFFPARATLEILIPDFVKQTSEEKPKDSEELEVRSQLSLCMLNSLKPSAFLHRIKTANLSDLFVL